MQYPTPQIYADIQIPVAFFTNNPANFRMFNPYQDGADITSHQISPFFTSFSFAEIVIFFAEFSAHSVETPVFSGTTVQIAMHLGSVSEQMYIYSHIPHKKPPSFIREASADFLRSPYCCCFYCSRLQYRSSGHPPRHRNCTRRRWVPE